MIKYVHTNILAKDWKKLSQFYIDVFGCKPVYPERDLKGEWIDNMTNISGVHIEGIHLELPGYENGPTIEIFGYNKSAGKNKIPQIDEIGFTHIAFKVDDVHEYVEKVLSNGGSFYGEIIENEIEGVGILTAVYMRDPEKNIVEIQNWK
ncbi:MAG: VOC family protein [Cyclobacteriaceae bacterium]|nr:VOC family protein [Cyclobacteriaceae bacterium]